MVPENPALLLLEFRKDVCKQKDAEAAEFAIKAVEDHERKAEQLQLRVIFIPFR